MACACKVNQEIDKINRYYSYNKKTNEYKPRMSVNKKDAAITLLIYVILLPTLPIVFLGVLFYSIFSKDGKISLRNILGFIHKTRNGRKQQNI